MIIIAATAAIAINCRTLLCLCSSLRGKPASHLFLLPAWRASKLAQLCLNPKKAMFAAVSAPVCPFLDDWRLVWLDQGSFSNLERE